MPRSFSSSMSSSICACISRAAHGAAGLQDAVRQRRLPVVDVGDDREVADELGVGHAANGGSYLRAEPSAPQRPARPRLDGLDRRSRRRAGAAGARPTRSWRRCPSCSDRSGRWTGTPCSVPQAASVARSSVLAATPPERASARMPSAAWTSSTRETSAVTMARWKDASRSTSSGSSASPGRAASRRSGAAGARGASPSSGPRTRSRASRRTRPNGKREAVAAAARRDAIDDGPSRVAQAGAPGDLVEGFAGRVVPRARERDDPMRSASTRTSSAWPPETTRPWKRIRQSGAAPRRSVAGTPRRGGPRDG